MKKVSLVFSIFVVVLIICGAAFGEQKTNKPSDMKESLPLPHAATKPMIVDIAIDDVYLDSQCSIWVRMINKGTVKIDKSLSEKVFVNGQVLNVGFLHHVVLEPGAVFAHGMPSSEPRRIISGSATVTAVIDFDNLLVENNEGNNSLTKTLACPRKPQP
jgi:hypothetical protein